MRRNTPTGISFEPDIYIILKKMGKGQTRSKFVNDCVREKLGLKPIAAPATEAPAPATETAGSPPNPEAIAIAPAIAPAAAPAAAPEAPPDVVK